MSGTKAEWSKVGEQFRELGSKLRGHFLENDPDAVTMAEAPIPTPTEAKDPSPEDAPSSGDDAAPKAEAKVKDVVDQLAAAADRIADTVRDAAKDPALKSDAGAAANALVDALAVTFDELGEEFKGLVGQLRTKTGGSQTQDPPPSDDSSDDQDPEK